MPFNMNIFRILGDVSHTLSKAILIWAIHSNKSAEGVSLITQVLYIAVFCTRYLDLFWVSPARSIWNFVLKNFYIFSSAYIVFLMMRVYARTREREKAWRLGAYCLAGSLASAPFVALVFQGWTRSTFIEVLWTFSIILESVCVLPQLLLLRQTTVPTVLDSFYLLTLGSYRFFYLLNWMVRLISSEHHFDPISIIFGTVQTALYVDFAWVYWTRQRVKLRGGGVVDSEDLGRGWLIRRLVGRKSVDLEGGEEERGVLADAEGAEEGEVPRPKHAHSWGARGISVSADEGVLESRNKMNGGHGHVGKPQSTGLEDEDEEEIADPSAFEDDDEEDVQYETRPAHEGLDGGVIGASGGISNGAEWREGDTK
ncbi:ER lumen protein retaining receptor [Cryomyces antarcticus]